MDVVLHIADTGKIPDPVRDAGFMPRTVGITPYYPPLPWPDPDAVPSGPMLDYPYVSYANMPPGPYAFSAVATLLPGGGVKASTHKARLPQAAWIALTVLVTFFLARLAFPRREYVAVLAVVLAATWPRLLFTGSSVNNDALMVLGSTAMIWRWWTGFRYGWSVRNAITLGIAFGVVLISKPNGYLIAGMSLAVLAISFAADRRRASMAALISAGIGVLIAAPWLWVATRRFGMTDLLGLRAVGELVSQMPHSSLAASSWDLGYIDMMRNYWVANFTRSFLTFTGVDTAIFVLVSIVFSAGAIGLFWSLAHVPHHWRRSKTETLMHATTIAAPLVVFLVASRNSFHNDALFGEQGRYLLPAFAPVMVYLAYGISQVTVLHRRRRLMTLMTCGVMLLLSFTSFIHGLHEPYWNEVARSQWILVAYGLYAFAGAALGVAIICYVVADRSLADQPIAMED